MASMFSLKTSLVASLPIHWRSRPLLILAVPPERGNLCLAQPPASKHNPPESLSSLLPSQVRREVSGTTIVKSTPKKPQPCPFKALYARPRPMHGKSVQGPAWSAEQSSRRDQREHREDWLAFERGEGRVGRRRPGWGREVLVLISMSVDEESGERRVYLRSGRCAGTAVHPIECVPCWY
ncbi:hypothetical protein NMY22_g17914 [Coprinellus aureogranulatus]|nr:hypothetical protein NMY22_g17914 [Coprinellus aureogranulatus]